jgi:predicted lipoprotein with Yx(FWY)xxD motif
MRTIVTIRLLGTAALMTLAACGGAASDSSSATGGSAATQSASGTAQSSASSPGAAATVTAASIGGRSLLVAASNGRTLYQFSQDKAGSGTSACTGGCISTWPALIVPAGTTPTAPGIAGQLGTITRSDGGGVQVTYNGRPLHFFSGDSKAGDTNGNYPGWSSVTVTSSGGAATGATSPAASSGY